MNRFRGESRPAGPARSVLRNLVTGILIAVVSLACGMAALEIGVRVFRPQHQFTCTVNTWDRERGTKQVPGARGFVTLPEYSIDLVINSKGLRDREYPYTKPEGTKRVLCLGGSFTCGYGVDAEDAYPKALERNLNHGLGHVSRWEVINGGVGSTGTANHVAFYEVEAHKYQPDIVFLDFCQKFFHDNVISGLYTLEGGGLAKHEAPSTVWRRIQGFVRFIPGYRGIFARSHLLNFVKVRVAKRHFKNLDAKAQEAQQNDDLGAGEEAITRALILRLREACADGGARLVVILMPRQNYGDWSEATLRLIDFLRSEGIPYIDLSVAFRAESAKGVLLAYPEDHHWNKAGHDLAAQELYRFIEDGPLSTGAAAPGA